MKYHFGSSNWNDTEVIDLKIRKRILTSKFFFESTGLPASQPNLG